MNAEIPLIRCRWVIAIWAVAFFAAVVGSLAIRFLIAPASGFWETTAVFYIAYVAIAIGLWLACRSQGIRTRQMIGPIPPPAKIFLYALSAIPVFLSSLGGGWLITLVAPGFFDGLVNEALRSKPEGAIQVLLTFGFYVVVAPLLEEFTFRGLLLTRLSVKYSPRTAIILSSLMFGLMHLDFLGAFVFGLVAASLYVRSKSLIAPIAIHCMNNLIAFAGFFFDSSDASIPSWLGLLGVFVGIPACVWLIARWTRLTMVPPYLAQWNEGSDPSFPY